MEFLRTRTHGGEGHRETGSDFGNVNFLDVGTHQQLGVIAHSKQCAVGGFALFSSHIGHHAGEGRTDFRGGNVIAQLAISLLRHQLPGLSGTDGLLHTLVVGAQLLFSGKFCRFQASSGLTFGSESARHITLSSSHFLIHLGQVIQVGCLSFAQLTVRTVQIIDGIGTVENAIGNALTRESGDAAALLTLALITVGTACLAAGSSGTSTCGGGTVSSGVEEVNTSANGIDGGRQRLGACRVHSVGLVPDHWVAAGRTVMILNLEVDHCVVKLPIGIAQRSLGLIDLRVKPLVKRIFVLVVLVLCLLDLVSRVHSATVLLCQLLVQLALVAGHINLRHQLVLIHMVAHAHVKSTHRAGEVRVQVCGFHRRNRAIDGYATGKFFRLEHLVVASRDDRRRSS